MVKKLLLMNASLYNSSYDLWEYLSIRPYELHPWYQQEKPNS